MCLHIRRSDYYSLLYLSVCLYAYNDWETAEWILVKFNTGGFYNHCRGILSLYVARKILTTTLQEVLLAFMCAGGLENLLYTCALSFLFYSCADCVTLYPYTRQKNKTFILMKVIVLRSLLQQLLEQFPKFGRGRCSVEESLMVKVSVRHKCVPVVTKYVKVQLIKRE